MRVLLAIASHENQHVGSLRSCYRIKVRDGDVLVDEWRTRGDVAREEMLDIFLDKFKEPDDALLMLDADQRHPEDMLEKLRAHDLDMVCAHYYRRETSPIQSLCYELGDGTYPFLPLLDPPTEGMVELAYTGFGCVLIKRRVFEAVARLIPEGQSPIAIAPIPELSGDHNNFGPDFRFFYLARKAGFRLWLDAGVESLHGVTLWLGHKSARKLMDYTDWANAAQDLLIRRLEVHGVNVEALRQRKRILEARRAGLLAQADEINIQRRDAKTPDEEPQLVQKLADISVAIYMMDGRLDEVNAWLEWTEKYPAIERPDQLPTTTNTPSQSDVRDGETQASALAQRQNAHRDNAVELLRELPDVG